MSHIVCDLFHRKYRNDLLKCHHRELCDYKWRKYMNLDFLRQQNVSENLLKDVDDFRKQYPLGWEV